MTAVIDALETLRNHIVPSDEKLQSYRDAIDRHCREKSEWRQRAEAAERKVAHVTSVLAHTGFSRSDYMELGHRVEAAIRESRVALERELKEARSVTRALDDARHDLRHHATALCQLYNKAAGNVLFGIGEKPDLYEIRQTIDEAIEAAVQERLRGETEAGRTTSEERGRE